VSSCLYGEDNTSTTLVSSNRIVAPCFFFIACGMHLESLETYFTPQARVEPLVEDEG